MHADYSLYQHSSGQPHVACKSYSVPVSVKEHIDFVTPTLHFDIPLGKKRSYTTVPLETRGTSSSKHTVQAGVGKAVGQPGNSPVDPKTSGVFSTIFTELSHCDTQITPVCLEALYKFEPYTQLAPKKNSYGIGM